MLANWRTILDGRTCQILEEAGMEVAGTVLQELKEKLDMGYDIKNPSAYAYRAVTNAMAKTGCYYPSELQQVNYAEYVEEAQLVKSSGPPAAKVAREEPDPSLSAEHQAARESLDPATVRALDSLELEDRITILNDLATKTDVRNPSAFVYRAVTNLQHRRNPPVAT